MPRVVKKAPTDATNALASVEALATIGLAEGQRVRFRKTPGGRWIEGTAARREPDGSLGLFDARGRQRSIPIEDVEVASRGPRGGRVWVPLAELAARDAQLDLF